MRKLKILLTYMRTLPPAVIKIKKADAILNSETSFKITSAFLYKLLWFSRQSKGHPAAAACKVGKGGCAVMSFQDLADDC